MIKHLKEYAPAKIVPGIISFISIFLFARIFSVEEYGRFTYVFSITSLIVTVFFSWIRLSSFRFYNIYKDKVGKGPFFSYIFSINISLAIVVISFCVVFKLINPNLYSYMLIGLIASITNAFFEQLLSLNRAALLSNNFKRYSILLPVIKLTLILLLVSVLGLREESIFIATIMASIILILISYFNFKKNNIGVNIKLINVIKTTGMNKEFLSYGLPLTFSFLFTIIIANSDRIIIKNYINESAVALYSLSYDISSFIVVNVFMILNLTFIPIILKKIDNKNKEVVEEIHNYFWLVCFVVVPITIFIFFFAPYIAKYILGEKYFNAQTILIIKLMGFGAFLSGMKSFFFDFAFQFGKKTYLQIIPIIIGAIVNVFLNIYLIPKYNIIGALYATIISYAISLIISILLGKRAFKLTIDKKSTIILMIQFIVMFLLLSLLIINKINIIGLIINSIIFITIFSFYFILNYKRLKKILL